MKKTPTLEIINAITFLIATFIAINILTLTFFSNNIFEFIIKQATDIYALNLIKLNIIVGLIFIVLPLYIIKFIVEVFLFFQSKSHLSKPITLLLVSLILIFMPKFIHYNYTDPCAYRCTVN